MKRTRFISSQIIAILKQAEDRIDAVLMSRRKELEQETCWFKKMYVEEWLNLRIKPKKRLKREKSEPLTVAIKLDR